MPDRLASKVLLVGWDTADWNIISPLLDAGALPCLEGLIERGTTGRLTATAPVVSPILWTTMVTGRRAGGHGILAAEEPDPDTAGTRAVSSRSRTCKALWNILTQAGLKSQTVNWVASHPAEPIAGACVSDRFARVAGPAEFPWPLGQGTIHPPRLEEALVELRVHPADLSAPHLLPFVPEGARIDQKVDRRLEILATYVAEAASVHAAATLLLEHEPCDFLAVRYAAFDPLSIHFLPFRAPRPEHVSEADFALYKDVVDGIYRFHDMMLRRLIELAGPEATVIVVSDHGFSADHLRTPGFDPTRPETIVSGYRAQGFFVMAGPRVRYDALIHGASVLDVAPTVLTLLGLAMGEDFEGRPLLEALDGVVAPDRIPSWESAPGDAGQHPREIGGAAAEDAAVIERLVALGYAEESEEDHKKRERLARASTFHLAISHLAASRPADAVPLLEGLVAEAPDNIIAHLHLAHGYLLLGRRDECRRVIDDVLLRHAGHPSADLVRGNLELAEGRPDVAIAALLNAEENKEKRPGLELLIGQCYLRLGRGQDAERAYRAVTARDEDFAPGYHGLAVSLNLQGRYEEAAEAALTALGLNYHIPRAHRALGFALTRLGETGRAVRAFETCLAMDPSDVVARNALERWRRPGVKAEATVEVMK
jgi:Flp pilus assembly protein TadD